MDEFSITRKHYDLIIKQGLDNLPYETGGFLGGKDGIISGVLPTFNKDWDTNTDVYQLNEYDFRSAHAFFQKHGLKYYGVYHTHPEGIAYPSQADIDTGHKYHFIISYQNNSNPHFAVFRIDNKVPIELPLKVLSDKGFSSVETKKKKQLNPEEKKLEDDKKELNDRISNILTDTPNIYPTLDPREDTNSDFSTFA